MPVGDKNHCVRFYGWRPSPPDQRDRYLRFSPHSCDHLTEIDHLDLSTNMAPCYDQADLGACVAHAVAGTLQYDEIKQQLACQTTPSRLFIYWNARFLDPFSSVNEDTGSTISMGIKAVCTYGFADEASWPYDTTQFSVEAPSDIYCRAVRGRITSYARINQTVQDIQMALANGNVVPFGFTVYESFESKTVKDTGVVPMPRRQERAVGGHAVVCVGFDNTTQRFKVRNSWGSDWGNNGYFTIPYAYLLNKNLASDFWTINAVP